MFGLVKDAEVPTLSPDSADESTKFAQIYPQNLATAFYSIENTSVIDGDVLPRDYFDHLLGNHASCNGSDVVKFATACPGNLF